MQRVRKWLFGGIAAIAWYAALAAPADATTLIRTGLEELVSHHPTIIVAEVVDTHSYWNKDGTFMLTDVQVVATDVLKGDPRERIVTLTLMGGTVDGLTTLIVGGAELIPGNSYVLFLDEQDLPGAKGVRTVRYHSQGAFNIRMAGDGLRAVSQAAGHLMVPDARGLADPPGGVEGIPLGTLMQTIREMAARPEGSRREVN